MAIDSKQKRMSALAVGCPWRGPLVDAAESGTTQGNRQAAAFAYSGILAAAAVDLPQIAFFEAWHIYVPGAVAAQVYAPGDAERNVVRV